MKKRKLFSRSSTQNEVVLLLIMTNRQKNPEDVAVLPKMKWFSYQYEDKIKTLILDMSQFYPK